MISREKKAKPNIYYILELFSSILCPSVYLILSYLFPASSLNQPVDHPHCKTGFQVSSAKIARPVHRKLMLQL